ncbi:3'(2'),5'-bisphosphate nucleotidase [Anaerolineales bacterium HSG6]|nr:3'(2'),5'-bisphosphate nucleotidase [Anaerolineales bacterium HSG6]MDM8532008.1 3'(2'),5'-bisphosphate nucleotidase [Anaerolineales bacterium HSG25]
MSYTIEKQIAIEAVTKAAILCTRVRAEMVGAESLEKGDKSPVTVADFGSQALVCEHIRQTFPRDEIVGEEDSADLKKPENSAILTNILTFVHQFHPQASSDMVCSWIDAGNGLVDENRYWTLDPIDGTKGFLRNDQYAIALALVIGGELKVAALACPALPVSLVDSAKGVGSIFVAVQGEGAYMAALPTDGTEPISSAFKQIQVASSSDEQNLRFVESVESGHGDHSRQQTIAQAAGISQASLRMDSQAKYGAVARGDAALYLRLPSPKSPDYREKIWDHAAGALIVEEAGGTVTDMHGQPLDFATDYRMQNNQGVVVSNGVLHQTVIQALKN